VEKEKEYDICVTNIDFYTLDKNKRKVLNVLKRKVLNLRKEMGKGRSRPLTSFCRPTLLHFYYWKERMEGRKQQFVVAK